MRPDALTEVYARYSGQVYLYALSLCGDRQLAEDLKQDCFVKAMLSYSGTAESIRAWLFHVCRNLWIDHLRKNKRLTAMPEGYEPADISADIPSGTVMREELKLVFEAMHGLPDNMRELILLDCILGIPQREIAAIMGMTPGAVRTLLCRARIALKKKMEGNGYEL